MSYPIIKGIIVHQRDVARIKEISLEKEKQRDKRLEIKKRREAKDTWKALITKVILNIIILIGLSEEICFKIV